MSTNPVPATAGPNSRTCADFDGVDDFLDTALNLSDFVTASTSYIIISIMMDGVIASPLQAVIGDAGQQFGIYIGSGPTVHGFNFDGSTDQVSTSASITTDTPLVISLRHESGALYLRVNNGTDLAVASGDTTTITGDLRLGMSVVTTNANIKVFECATFDCVPPSGTRDALEQDFMAWIGAELLEEPYLNATLGGIGALSIDATVV